MAPESIGFDEITILYGSQTGTAEDVARSLHRQMYQSNSGTTNIRLFGCDEFLSHDPENTTTRQLLVFVVATTGNGDPPDNMRFFWRAIMSRQFSPENIFGLGKTVEFAVLGLGDSSYERFNFVAKKLDRRFEQVFEKQPFVSIGVADEQDARGLYSVIDPWSASLVEKLGFALPSKDAIPNFRFKVSLSNGTSDKLENSEIDLGLLLNFPCDATKASLTANERLTTPDHFQDVRHVRLKTKDIVYYPGDVCYIQPGNIREQVEEFFNLFDLKSDQVVLIEQSNKTKVTLSVSDLIEKYFNLSYSPSRSFYDLLSRFAKDSMEKERLQELASSYDDLLDYSLRPKRNVVEVFGDFRQTTQALRELPKDQFLTWLFELIPPIRARAFSIASAQIEVGAEIQLLIAIVKFQTKIRKQRLGLCTNWLIEAKIDPDNFSVPIWVRPSSMRFPIMRHAPSTEPFPPMIMIGPGTGLAPFRAYIQYRLKLAKVYGSDILWANKENLWLFFGCRYEKRDFLHGNELLSYKEEGKLGLDVAFSRDTADKVYVQHRILENRADIADWILRRGAHVCIAGNALQMPKSVKTAIRDSLVGENWLESTEKADKYVELMEKNGRFVVEAWS